MLADKFYGKRYYFSNNEKKNVFTIVGEIIVTDDLRVTNFGTEFRKDMKYTQMIGELESAVIEAVEIIHSNPTVKNHKSSNYKSIIQSKHEQLLNVDSLSKK